MCESIKSKLVICTVHVCNKAKGKQVANSFTAFKKKKWTKIDGMKQSDVIRSRRANEPGGGGQESERHVRKRRRRRHDDGGGVSDAHLLELDASARFLVHLKVGQRLRHAHQEQGSVLATFELAGVVDTTQEAVLGAASV